MTGRVGIGFDVHRASADPERQLVLGGVVFPGVPGLEGHSDADVVAHAAADALLGAAGLGDLGDHFPDTDEQWKEADSLQMLSAAAGLVAAAGWSIANVDCAVVLDSPKLKAHKAEMERRMSDVVGGPVTVKPKRSEQLGFIGRGEGIACWAVALLEQ